MSGAVQAVSATRSLQMARTLFVGVLIGASGSWVLGMGIIGFHPWWHGVLYTAGLLVMLVIAWGLRRRLLAQAALVLAVFGYPVVVDGASDPMLLVFGAGMLVPLAIVLVVIVLSVKMPGSSARR